MEQVKIDLSGNRMSPKQLAMFHEDCRRFREYQDSPMGQWWKQDTAEDSHAESNAQSA